MAHKDTLVEQVKAFQRASPESKQAWSDYCDQNLGGVYDPAKHDATSLAIFMVRGLQGSFGPKTRPALRGATAAAASVPWPLLPAPLLKAPVRAAPPHSVPLAVGAWPPRQPLVEVRIAPAAVPPSSPAGAASVVKLHTVASAALGTFQAAAASSNASPVGRSLAEKLQDIVSTGQRHSQSWKAAWQAFCTVHNGGSNDPTSCDNAFLVRFMEYLGFHALKALTGTAAEQGIVLDADLRHGAKRPAPSAGPPAPSEVPKRPRLESETPSVSHAPTSAVVGQGPTPSASPKRSQPPTEAPILQDSALAVVGRAMGAALLPDLVVSEKAELVARVRGLLGSSLAAKTAWCAYCDLHAGGVKDPGWHESAVLQEFIVAYSS